ncbi:MAG TPA: SDR family oxidoreductase [Burkholderiaceae bacterium]
MPATCHRVAIWAILRQNYLTEQYWHLTRALSLELTHHGIRVNALSPGLFQTEMTEHMFHGGYADAMIKHTPAHRAGEPADLDGALLLLASDASRFMSGSVLVVDGGILNSSL